MKPMKQKKVPMVLLIIALVAVFFIMSSLRRCSGRGIAGVEIPEATAGDTVNVALMYAPMTYYSYGDTVSGLSYDMLRKMGDDLGLTLRFYPVMSLDESLKALEKGNYRILAAIPVNSDLRKRFIFSDDVYLDRQMLVQRKRADGSVAVRSSLDLADDTLHLEKDSPAIIRIKNLSDEIGSPIHIVTHDDLSEEYLFMKVASGDIRYAVVNELTARRLHNDFPEVDFSTPVSFTQFQSWVINSSDTLLQRRVNEWLKRFKTTAEYDSLLRRYSAKR